MDLQKTGRFIRQLRGEKSLTQEQLGQILGVTNKTVSRWETGTYLPPADMLLSMSTLFGVSINEILTGRRLNQDEYKAAAEDNLRHTVMSSCFSLKETVSFYQRKWLREHIAAMCCRGAGIACVFTAGVICRQPLLIAASVLLLAAAHAWRHNTMMIYVEQKTYGSTDSI